MNIREKFAECCRCNIKTLDLSFEDMPSKAVMVLPEGDIKKVFICFHGYQSSKEEWLEFDGYTKGGNLLSKLLNIGYGFIIFDAYKHGQNKLADEYINYDEALDNDDFYIAFFEKTLEYSDRIYDYIKNTKILKDLPLAILTYSMGGTVATSFMNQHNDIEQVVQMVPSTYKGYEEEPYAPMTQMDHVSHIPILFIFAEEDEYESFENYIGFYNIVPFLNKTQYSLKSGHSLSLEYVDKVVEWLKER